MSGIDDMLIRMARRVLDGVISQLTAQQVVGGVWQGDGADAFVNEVSSISIPSVGQVGQQISTMSVNVQFARDVIDQADEQINRLVESRITDAFKFY